MNTEQQFCKRCGNYFDINLDRCTKCNSPAIKISRISNDVEKKIRKIPILAAFLSFLMPGLGQLYNNEIGKGFGYFFMNLLIYFTFLYIAIFKNIPDIMSGKSDRFGANIYVIIIMLVAWLIFWIYMIFDAYKTAEDINNEMKRYIT